MKYLYFKIVLLALIAVFPAVMYAQTSEKIEITATLNDGKGKPLSGAVIQSEEDPTINAVSDNMGIFTINASPNSILTIMASGFKTKTVVATEDLREIPMELDVQMVQVAHKKVERRVLNTDVTVVNIPEIMERNYMLHGMENLQAFANGLSGNLWGMDDALILVDGVPRDLGSVMPTEIEQVTFLKGVAAVALYGSRAAKGVVYITTKRGEIKDLQIKAWANTGIHTPRMIPQYLGSAEYMSLYNEARRNDGLNPLYSDETIYHHASGSNPYRYPSIDFYSSEYLKNYFSRHDGTVEISGGNNRARYYTNIGYNTQGSLLNFGEAIDHNRNDRFNVRGNVDMNLNEYLWAKVDAAAIYYTGRGVNTNYWQHAATLRPHRLTPLVPLSMVEANDEASWTLINSTPNIIDGKYLLGGNQLELNNPFATIYAGGHNKYTSRQFQFNTGIGADLKNVLKGLTFETNFGVDYATSYSQTFINQYRVFEPIWNNYAGYDQITELRPWGTADSRDGIQHMSGGFFRQTLSLSGQLNYVNTINNTHSISAMLIANGFQQTSVGQYHRISNANLGIHLGYNYLNKYYADFNGSVIHSSRLPEANRRAFSPTLSLGWRISEEGFLSRSSVVDDLRLTVSGGILHTDLNIHDYYLYTDVLNQTEGSWYGWRDGSLSRSTDVLRGGNPDLTFSRREEVNMGIEASLFKRFITFQGSVFANQMTGNIVQPHALFPSYFSTGWPRSSFLPWINYNIDQRTGFDFNLNFNKKIGTVDYTLGVIGTYYETKAVKRAEVFEDDYQYRQGKPIDGIWGLRNNGFFNNVEQISDSPNQTFGQVQPGDIKYIDQNGDGLINSQDEVFLGRGGWFGAPFTLGLNFNAKWKNFNLFALGLGRYGAYAMRNSSYFWVRGEDKYSEVVRDRWTEETMNTATYPRLTVTNGDNNFRNSDFWLYSTNRFDLAKVQLTYDVPQNILKKTFLQDVGIFVSGFNLLTIAPERDILLLNVGSAPQTRFYNVGVKATF